MYWENIDKDIWDSGKVNIRDELFKVREETVNHPIIYFDMDGVLANWNWERSVEHPDGVTMEEVFAPGYFRNLKPISEYVEFAKDLTKKGIDVRILSKSIYTAIEEKWNWLQEYMPFIDKEHIYFVPLDENKSDFVPNINNLDVLIDDYNPNLSEWPGVPIKAITEKNTINPNFYWVVKNTPVFRKLESVTCALLNAVKKELIVTNDEDKDIIRINRLSGIYKMNMVDKNCFVDLCNNIELSVEGVDFSFSDSIYNEKLDINADEIEL